VPRTPRCCVRGPATAPSLRTRRRGPGQAKRGADPRASPVDVFRYVLNVETLVANNPTLASEAPRRSACVPCAAATGPFPLGSWNLDNPWIAFDSSGWRKRAARSRIIATSRVSRVRKRDCSRAAMRVMFARVGERAAAMARFPTAHRPELPGRPQLFRAETLGGCEPCALIEPAPSGLRTHVGEVDGLGQRDELARSVWRCGATRTAASTVDGGPRCS
jgi:hypothetical protein